MGSIRFLCKIGHPPHITLVANAVNSNHINQTVEFLCNEGVKGITISHTIGAGFAKNNNQIGIDFWKYADIVKEAQEIAKRYGTKIGANTNFPFLINDTLGDIEPNKDLASLLYGTIDGRRSLYIDYKGGIYPTSYDFGAKELCLGNVRTDDLIEIWNKSNILEEFRTAKAPKKCETCRYFDYCRGGPITNYNVAYFRGVNENQIKCPLISQVTVE